MVLCSYKLAVMVCRLLGVHTLLARSQTLTKDQMSFVVCLLVLLCHFISGIDVSLPGALQVASWFPRNVGKHFVVSY